LFTLTKLPTHIHANTKNERETTDFEREKCMRKYFLTKCVRNITQMYLLLHLLLHVIFSVIRDPVVKKKRKMGERE
jgi:hypothetical protein